MAVTELGQRHQAETAVGPFWAAAEFRFLVRTPPEAESPTGGDPQTPALSVFPLLSVHVLFGSRCFSPLVPDPAGGAGDAAGGGIPIPYRRSFPNPKFAKRANKAQRLPGGTFRPYASQNSRA